MKKEKDTLHPLAIRPIFRLDSDFFLFYTLPIKKKFLLIEL